MAGKKGMKQYPLWFRSTLALGKIIGVSDTTICAWENNKHDIKGEQLVALAKYFSVTTDYLLGLEEL